MTPYSGIPPNYDRTPRSSTSSTFTAGDSQSTFAAPVRYLYYQIFDDEVAVPSKQQILDYDEPSIGRIRAHNIAPPRTAGIVKRAILRAESVDPSRVSKLFLVASGNGDAVADEVRLDITDEKGQGPGSSPDVPIGIVLGFGPGEVAGLTIAHTEPGLVANKVKPRGWKDGRTLGNRIYLALATKSTGGIRWMDGSIREGQRLYVDASSLTSVADGSKVYSMYLVILVETRHYGFMPSNSVQFDPNPPGWSIDPNLL